MLSWDDLTEVSAPVLCMGLRDRGRVGRQTAGPLAVTSYMMHLIDFQHLSVIVRVRGAAYRFCVVPPNNKSKLESFVRIDQLVVPVSISSNMKWNVIWSWSKLSVYFIWMEIAVTPRSAVLQSRSQDSVCCLPTAVPRRTSLAESCFGKVVGLFFLF